MGPLDFYNFLFVGLNRGRHNKRVSILPLLNYIRAVLPGNSHNPGLIKRKAPCLTAGRFEMFLLLSLPGPCSVATGRARVCRSIIVQGSHVVYRAIVMCCRIHGS
jgi:hypothetical protein